MNSEIILEKIKGRINKYEFLDLNRTKKNVFTRRRKMPFENLIYFMINLNKKTTQLELTEFMLDFTKHKNITKSAYCQQRMNLKPEAFIELNNLLVEEFYSDNTHKKWQNFRLLSIDGSTLELPNSEEIIRDFGTNNDNNNIPMAKISTMYDLLNEIILDTQITKYRSSELHLSINHFIKLREEDLLILDRGYSARWLFHIILSKKVNFVIRLQHNFGNEIDEFWKTDETSKIIEVSKLSVTSKKIVGNIPSFKFRIVKVILDNGEVEVLATSLLDEEKYSSQIFKELYHKRWGIETNYNHLKNNIEIGNFTGYSSLVIKQYFYVSAFIANIQSLIVNDAQKKLDENKKERKYNYKINKNLSLGYMKNRVIKILLSNNPNYYTELVNLFLNVPIPIRPDRKATRKKHTWTRNHFMNQKRSL